MSPLQKAKLTLWIFSIVKVPMIGYVNPKLISLDENELVVKIKLRRRTKNHLNSMYFGALSVGADVSGGLLAVYFAKKMKEKISLVFKSFHADFLKRPEQDVYFICKQGQDIKQMIEESKASKERVNKIILIDGVVDYPKNPEKVAEFKLELSVKVKD